MLQFGSNSSPRISNLPITEFKDWLEDLIQTKEEHISIQTTALIYNIWHAHNLPIIENKFLLEEEVIQRTDHNIADYKAAIVMNQDSYSGFSHRSTHPNHMQSRNTRWIKPNHECLKANSDANLQEEGTWGLSAIVRDGVGLVMASATWKCNSLDCATIAEAFRMYKISS